MVAKGYSQIPGIDFDDTFSPVVKLTTLRMFIALAAVKNLELEQLDVTTAFLYGNLEEEIFMQVPQGVTVPADLPRPVCRLQKTLYGLKQSPRAWYSRIDTYLKELGFGSLNADSNVYIKQEDVNFLALAIYVDDIIILSSSWRMIFELKEHLRKAFKITNAGALTFCIGMQLQRDRSAGTIFLHQNKYVKQILDRCGMTNCKHAATPVEQNTKYLAQVGDVPERDLAYVEEYPSMNGSVMHLIVGTRPDLAFSSGLSSRFVSKPNRSHQDLLN